MGIEALNRLTDYQEASRTASLEIASAIELACESILPTGITTIDAQVHRIRQCADRKNIWFAKDLHNAETGEAFNGHGRYWRCHSKLCPDCLRHTSKRNRKKFLQAIANQKLWTNEAYYFLTFTQPNRGLPLLESRAILYKAWTLFLKRRYIRRVLNGYCKDEEFTVTANGIHYHIHTLWRSSWVKYDLIRRLWTESLRTASEDAGFSLETKTKDDLSYVRIERIVKPESIAKELCKYMTKSDSWERIPSAELLELVKLTKFPRMFELGGSFALSCEDRRTTFRTIVEKELYLDTESVSDALERETAASWRNEVEQIGLRAWKVNLATQIEAARRCRQVDLKKKYPAAVFRDLEQVEKLRLELRGEVAA